MIESGTLHRLAAFTDRPTGGNPAGVWIGEVLPEPARMQAIARAVGDSETAFVAPAAGERRTVRYYSVDDEVPFCGHATIAAAALLGERDGEGRYRFDTRAGEVAVEVQRRGALFEAVLTSVEPQHRPADRALRDELLAILGWQADELDPAIPPALAFAGAWHFVLAAGSAARLARLDYDFAAARTFMQREGLTTLQLIWRETPGRLHARNPFPVGGVVEDPATGAAAAALGGYLRDAGLLVAPARLEILQGEAMGRPSRLLVQIPLRGGIEVAGTALPIALPAELAALG